MSWYQRPALEDMTQYDWYKAKTSLSDSEYSRLRGIATKAGLVDDGDPYSVTMQSSETSNYMRSRQKAEVKKFNKELKGWGDKVVKDLKSSIAGMVKRDVNLSSSLGVYYQIKRGEIIQIGFTFAREGAYIYHGAGKGYGGNGSRTRWFDSGGNARTVSADSMGKMGTGRRKSIDWFNPVVSQHLEELASIVAEYDSTIVVNTTNLLMD